MSAYFETLSDEAILAHDRQREMSTEARARLISMLTDRLGRENPCLDAGAGTGAIAIPLHQARVCVIAADLSLGMLRELRNRQFPGKEFPVIQANILALPFPDASFGSVHVAHTLHLLDDWHQPLAELVRVTMPVGVLAVTLGFDPNPHPAIGEINRAFFSALPKAKKPEAVVQPPSPEAQIEEFQTIMGSLRTTPEAPINLEYENSTSPAQEIDRLQHNPFAVPNHLTRAQLDQAASQARTWAKTRFDSMDVPIHRHRTLTYYLFRKD